MKGIPGLLCIYDIVHKKLYVKNQEGDIEYTFTLQK